MEPIQTDVKPTKKSTKASRFVAKLSPKKFQRKREITKIATMKVKINEIYKIFVVQLALDYLCY